VDGLGNQRRIIDGAGIIYNNFNQRPGESIFKPTATQISAQHFTVIGIIMQVIQTTSHTAKLIRENYVTFKRLMDVPCKKYFQITKIPE